MIKKAICLLAAGMLCFALFTTAFAAEITENNPLGIDIPEEVTITQPGAQTEDEEDDDEDDIDKVVNYAEYTDDQVEKSGFTRESLYMAARLIYAEGKKQSEESFEAMASVVYNRVKSKKFPKTIEEVTFQKNQFTVTRDVDKFMALKPSKAAMNAVYKVFVAVDQTLPENVMFFRSASLSKKWGKRVYYDTIGGNMYYS